MRMLYVTENNRLAGMQDVSACPVRQIFRARTALAAVGREGFVSDKGLAICCVCRALLHEAELPAGTVSHGYCPACLAIESARLEYITDPDEFDRE